MNVYYDMNFVRHSEQCPTTLYGNAQCKCNIPHNGYTPHASYSDYLYGGPTCDCVYHNSRSMISSAKEEGFAPALQQPSQTGIIQNGMGFRQWHNWNMPAAIPNLPQTMSNEQMRYIYGGRVLRR